MRYRLFCLIVFIVLLVDFAIAVSNPKPEITIKFDEYVTILTVNLTNTLRQNITINRAVAKSSCEIDKVPCVFVYQPAQNLKEDSYNFNVTVEDQAGNKKAISLNFTIAYADLGIVILNPEYGITNISLINITASTERKAMCRYSIITPEWTLMNNFEVKIDDKTHKILNFPLRDSETRLYIVCNDTDYNKLYRKDQDIILDKEKPVIQLLSVTPEAIYEGGPPFNFELVVKTNELTTCEYVGNGKENQRDMGNLGDKFNLTHNKTISANFNEYTYSYNITCKDRIGYQSDSKEIKFIANTKVPIKLILVNPQTWTSEQPVNFIIDTTKKALCTLDNQYFSGEPKYRHEKQLTLSEGVTRVKAECVYSIEPGKTNTTTQFFEIKIDRTKPRKPVVNDTSNIAEFPEFTYTLKGLSARFSSFDNVSGIAKFNYSIIFDRNNSIMHTQETDAGACANFVCIKEVNVDVQLTNQTKYKFKVTAIDNAGLLSEETASNGITVDTSKKPIEKIPPSVFIRRVKIDEGIRLAIECRDEGEDASGCDPLSYKYSLAKKKTECLLEGYTKPVIVTESSYFCWEARDNIGNIATGVEFIEIKIKDDDRDTIPDGVDNCPQIANTDQNDSDKDEIGDKCDNCPERYNPTQADKDSDKIGDGCDKCPNTKKGSKVNEFGCSANEAANDSDNDGMPDEWEDKYKLDKNDPKDAGLDKDEDGATNLEEYRAGTDPTDKNSKPQKSKKEIESGNDKDNDGMPDEWEIEHGLDPNNAEDASLDLDEEGLLNSEEFSFGTDPTNKDTDGDGFDDKNEIDSNSDPLDPNSFPERKFFKSVLLIAGTLALLAGIGYLGYTQIPKYLRKKPQPIVPLHIAQRSVQRPRPAPEQQRLLIQRILQRRGAMAERQREAFAKLPEQPTQIQTPIQSTEEILQKQPVEPIAEKEDVFKRLSRIARK